MEDVQVLNTCFSCGTGATHRYEWPWGEKGFSCPDHLAELRGTAGRLKRPVQIMELGIPGPPAAPPSSTEETRELRRVALHVSSELEEERRTSAELRDQIFRLRSELANGERQIADLRELTTSLREALQLGANELAATLEEVKHLKDTERARCGLPPAEIEGQPPHT